jgi:CRP/FNR family transcriptional regulator, cyclic AMP receptor protein
MAGTVAGTEVEEIRAALAGSFLGALPTALLRSLAEGVGIETFLSRSLVFRGEQPNSGVLLVVSGLARVFLRGHDGRQTTARYASENEFIGLTALLADGMQVDIEALTEMRCARIPAHRIRTLAMGEPRLSWELARYMARNVDSCTEVVGSNVFLPVRARVARHLLDLAHGDAGGHAVEVSQQYIANSIGSVREVVARVVKMLLEEGVVARDGRTLRLLDLAALHEIARGER